jgi:hypothetical protein
VWLYFLHTDDRSDARREPWPCPTGLFFQALRQLQACESHRGSEFGKQGMVYWRPEAFEHVPLDDVHRRIAASPRPGIRW